MVGAPTLILASSTTVGMVDFFYNWDKGDLVDDLVLQQDVSDQHRLKLSSRSYNSKSAYQPLFLGTKFAPWKRIWKIWAPLKCRFFIWLAIDNWCWTVDCPAKRGMPHPLACPLCDQVEETIQRTLISCLFTWQA